MKWIRENINSIPSFAPFVEQIEVAENHVFSNPALCVETCKALVEGICKTILKNKNIVFSDQITFNVLVQDTIRSILSVDDVFRNDLAELGRRVASVSQKLGEIRNNAGFASHDLDVLNPRLTETVSLFALKITDTIGGFILNCYTNNRNAYPDQRIHYSDCSTFNEYFDDMNPIQTGIFTLSASAALYAQDYEAYKEAFFEYLSDLQNEIDDNID